MKNLNFSKKDKAIASLSYLGLLSSFILLFTACDTTETITTTPAPNADTTVETPQTNTESPDLEAEMLNLDTKLYIFSQTYPANGKTTKKSSCV